MLSLERIRDTPVLLLFDELIFSDVNGFDVGQEMKNPLTYVPYFLQTD